MSNTPVNTGAIERAVAVLANTMRLYVEAHLRFPGIFDVDREEAVNNLDRAFEAKLNAFHSLYDVSKTSFPYSDFGDTALLIAVRNALHHHDHPLFHSFLSRLYLEDGFEKWNGAAFLLAKHPTRHGVPVLMTHFVRLDDIDARLNPARASPLLDTRTKGTRLIKRYEVIDRGLGLPLVRQHGVLQRYPEDQIYLDLMPVFISAISRVFTALRAAGVTFRGFDAQAYLAPFTTEIDINLEAPGFRSVRIGPMPFQP
ncbi:hypothetical protein [Brevundimonas vesicularis]|uniref:hypothetical protein n=1 Tax=Brevundimonas vesicularis TaxID=41276 RepID=UPI000ABABE91|nr:hypothetical protein [Brevundimonas vesicularis]